MVAEGMGFGALLRKKLGPMENLAPQSEGSTRPQLSQLWFRRAAGLEIRLQPEKDFNKLWIGPAHIDAEKHFTISLADAYLLADLYRWKNYSELNLDPNKLSKWLDEGLLVYSITNPSVNLPGRVYEQKEIHHNYLKDYIWPTLAVENTIEIAPMAFMPRPGELEDAKVIGARFVALERGHEVFGLTITGSEKTGTILRELIALLRGPIKNSEILPNFSIQHQSLVTQLLELLFKMGCVESRETPLATLDAQKSTQVTWLGHASILYQSHQNLLIDPFFSPRSIQSPYDQSPQAFDLRQLPPIDAVFITHGDNDHLNPHSLARLPRSTNIYYPACGSTLKPFQVDIPQMLEILGFENLHPIDVGDQTRFGETTVTALPFRGEDWGLDLAQLTFLIESPALSIYCSADAGPMPKTYQFLAERERKIDLAFMGISGCQESLVSPPGLGYGNFYERWIDRNRYQEWTKHCAGPKDAVDSLKIFRPGFAFGYASGGAEFIRTEYSDRGSHHELVCRVQEAELSTRMIDMPLGKPVRADRLMDYISPRTVASQE